jgi:hypothetical protein
MLTGPDNGRCARGEEFADNAPTGRRSLSSSSTAVKGRWRPNQRRPSAASRRSHGAPGLSVHAPSSAWCNRAYGRTDWNDIEHPPALAYLRILYPGKVKRDNETMTSACIFLLSSLLLPLHHPNPTPPTISPISSTPSPRFPPPLSSDPSFPSSFHPASPSSAPTPHPPSLPSRFPYLS